MTLDVDLETFAAMLDEAGEVVLRLYGGLEQRRVSPDLDQPAVQALFDEPLPRTGVPLEQVLARFESEVVEASTLNIHPRFISNVMSGGSQVGVVAELLLAALNVNGGKWRVAPAHTEIEQRVVSWLGEFVGFPADGGLLVSGGSSANLHGLAAARAARAPIDVGEVGLAAAPPMTVYASDAVHTAVDKSVDLLGLGRRQLRRVPTREDGTADVGAIAAAVEADRRAGRHPIALVGNAGTVNTGAVDDLGGLADLAEEQGLWFHVDGAYGAPAAATATAGHRFAGIERADSLALDPHKWLSVPFAAGCIMVRDRQRLRDAFRAVPAYLRDGVEGQRDAMEHGFPLSRPFRALKVWMTFLVYGADRLAAAIDDNIATMAHLAALVDGAPDLERLAPQVLSVVCFRYRPPGVDDPDLLDALNRALVPALDADGRVFISGTLVDGRECLRACTVNHRTDRRAVEEAAAVVREVGARVAPTVLGG